MGQGPLGYNAIVSGGSGGLVPLETDSAGNLRVTVISNVSAVVSGATYDAEGNTLVSNGGTAQAYNVTSAAVIKASPGRLDKLVITNGGTTSASWTLNDCATISAATSANQIVSIPYSAALNVPGGIVSLDWPCSAGIVVSTVPGGSPVAAISYK